MSSVAEIAIAGVDDRRQAFLDEMLLVTAWELIFGSGCEQSLLRRIGDLMAAGARVGPHSG